MDTIKVRTTKGTGTMTAPATVPMWRQLAQIKARYPDTILMFRAEDRYELFDEDADTLAAFASIGVSERKDGDRTVRVTGISLADAELTVGNLIAGGYKVAVCERR